MTFHNDMDGLEDLRAQFERDAARRIENDARELARAEQAATTLEDRLAGAVGHNVRVGLLSGRVFEGRLVGVGRGWLEIHAAVPGLDAIIRSAALAFLDGDFRKVREEDRYSPRLPLVRRLERLAAACLAVNIVGVGYETQCRITRVGADHVDVQADSVADPTMRGMWPGQVAPARIVPCESMEAIYAVSLAER